MTLRLPREWMKDTTALRFAMTVKNDSLAVRGIRDGDIVICEEVEDPFDVPQGAIVATCVDGQCCLAVWWWAGERRAELRDGRGKVVLEVPDAGAVEVEGIVRYRFGAII